MTQDMQSIPLRFLSSCEFLSLAYLCLEGIWIVVVGSSVPGSKVLLRRFVLHCPSPELVYLLNLCLK